MAKTIKAKAYDNEVHYQVFNGASGEVEKLVANFDGEKLTEAKATKILKDECKYRTEENKKNGIKGGKVLFLKIEKVERVQTIWELDFDDFMRYAHRA